ncbi:MAG: acyltransferase [Acidobacteriaceae bacterium]
MAATHLPGVHAALGSAPQTSRVSPPTRAPHRNTRFDLLRILFALLVILSHAPELTDGNPSRELFHRLSRTDETFGGVAVYGFFLLSGFLIVQSWQADPHLLNFLRKRLLRIVPGYLVAVLVSVLVVGLLAPATPHFFRQLGLVHLKGIALLSSPATPPVLPGATYPLVNGALWTIGYEFRCYLLVALFGVCGLLRRRYAWLAATLALAALAIHPVDATSSAGHILQTLFGEPSKIFHLAAAFFVGGCFHLFRERIPFRPRLALLAAFALLAGSLSTRTIQAALVLFGGYLLFYFAHLPQASAPSPRRFPDISYGLYLYGWPAESLWIWFFHTSPWLTFVVSALIAATLGWLSWHFVERPMLKLKRHATAQLPPR